MPAIFAHLLMNYDSDETHKNSRVRSETFTKINMQVSINVIMMTKHRNNLPVRNVVVVHVKNCSK